MKVALGYTPTLPASYAMQAAGDDLPTLLTNQVTRALWPTVSAGQESPLLSVVVEVLYKHLVDKPLQVLASGAQRLGRTHLLIDRLKADLCVLMSPCSLNELKVSQLG